MNKQEVIEKIEASKRPLVSGKTFDHALDIALNIVKQLDEPEKPVVPQFIDTWIQGAKYNGFDLYEAMTDDEMPDEVATWIVCHPETFAKAWFYGYEVEKEKLYTVEIPNPNDFVHTILHRTEKGIIISYSTDENYKNIKQNQLTEAEIKQDFDWAWQFAKEVKE